MAFDIESVREMCKLTVVHEFLAGSVIGSMVSQGWPLVLSSLKSMLETGTHLP